MTNRLVRLCVASALGLSLSGCIAAAAAIPVLAGGGVVGSRVLDDDESGAEERAAIPRPPFETQSPPVASADRPSASEPERAVAATPAPTAAPSAAPGALPPVRLTLPNGEEVAIGASAATGSAASASAQMTNVPSATTVDTGAYSGLKTYAEARALQAATGAQQRTALLVAPGALQPETTECSVSQPAVLIDLDPGDDLLDTAATFAPNPGLAETLASLREQDVSVHWISGNSAAEASAIREALAATGLDPEGRDELVLMRYPDDRKQTRRRAVGATHCLIAIAGDQRRDFDELYAYLKNRDAALALESLLGEGWFLIPAALQPITPQSEVN